MSEQGPNDHEQADESLADEGSRAAGKDARANRKREAAAKSKPSRSAGHVRSGARMLSREAKKVLKRHRARIAEKVVAEIETTVETIDGLQAQKPNEDLVALELEAEHLDELLHQHASFARKSALRDSLENIAIAIGVALAVRSCVYEPFKIPSGSMMPTLRAGDHIFVNKFAYGIQIPLTTRVVGEDWVDSIARGDVIVFRYPLDEADDFIKRVIGLPGDSVRATVDRRRIEIKRAGTDEFEAIEREAVDDERCLNEASSAAVDGCTVFREVLDDHTYTVRYRDDMRSADPSMTTFVVPEGFLLVMGDNRNASHDSLAWTVQVDAVSASGLISRIDVRDLSDHHEGRIELHDEVKHVVANDDANVDRARYLAERPSPAHGLELETWRASSFTLEATYAAVAKHADADELATMDTLLDGARISQSERARLSELGESLGEFYFGRDESRFDLVFRAPGDDVFFHLHCGRARCERRSDLADRVGRILEAYAANPDYDSRELLVREPGRQSSFPGRGKVEERYLERQFGRRGQGVRLRAWRKPNEGMAALRDAALADLDPDLDRGTSTAAAITDLSDDAWVVPLASGWAVVNADANHEMLTVLECGPKRCDTQAEAIELATAIAGRFEDVLADPERMPELLGQSDVGGLAEVPVAAAEEYYWDHLEFRGSVLDDSHSLTIEVERKPEVGLQPAVDAQKAKLDNPESVAGLGPSAWYGLGSNGHQFVFAIAETELVVSMSCRVGMCPDRETARALADRAYSKGLDPENFLEKNVSRRRPFVPRGNVKGRAEVIWWPTARFWKKID